MLWKGGSFFFFSFGVSFGALARRRSNFAPSEPPLPKVGARARLARREGKGSSRAVAGEPQILGGVQPGAFHGGQRVGAPAPKASVEGAGWVGDCPAPGEGGKGKSRGRNSLLLAEFLSLPPFSLPLSSPGSPVSPGLCPSVRPPPPYPPIAFPPSGVFCLGRLWEWTRRLLATLQDGRTDGPMDGQTSRQAGPAVEWRGAAWRGSSPEFLPLPGVGWAGPGPGLPLRLPQASAASSPPSSPLSPPSVLPARGREWGREREKEREPGPPSRWMECRGRSASRPAIRRKPRSGWSETSGFVAWKGELEGWRPRLDGWLLGGPRRVSLS